MSPLPPLPPDRPGGVRPGFRQALGALLFVGGAIGLVVFWNMEVAVRGYVNLGLMDDRRNGLLLSAAAAIVGLILLLADRGKR